MTKQPSPPRRRSTPEQRRQQAATFWVDLVTRKILPPTAGTLALAWLLVTHQLEPWQLPLIAGLIGSPLVSWGSKPQEGDA